MNDSAYQQPNRIGTAFFGLIGFMALASASRRIEEATVDFGDLPQDRLTEFISGERAHDHRDATDALTDQCKTPGPAPAVGLF